MLAAIDYIMLLLLCLLANSILSVVHENLIIFGTSLDNVALQLFHLECILPRPCTDCSSRPACGAGSMLQCCMTDYVL